MSIFEDQKKFMLAGNQTVDKLNFKQMDLYESLIHEEKSEFQESIDEFFAVGSMQNQSEAIKEAIDILVVVSGWLISNGIDAQKAWDIVNANNMAKVKDKVVKDEKGKIQKSPESIERKKQMMIDLMGLI